MACYILGPCLISINKRKTIYINVKLKNPPRYGKLFYLLEITMGTDTNHFIQFHSTTLLTYVLTTFGRNALAKLHSRATC